MLKVGGGTILIVVSIILGESLGSYWGVGWRWDHFSVWVMPWGGILWGVGFILCGLWEGDGAKDAYHPEPYAHPPDGDRHKVTDEGD